LIEIVTIEEETTISQRQSMESDNRDLEKFVSMLLNIWIGCDVVFKRLTGPDKSSVYNIIPL